MDLPVGKEWLCFLLSCPLHRLPAGEVLIKSGSPISKGLDWRWICPPQKLHVCLPTSNGLTKKKKQLSELCPVTWVLVNSRCRHVANQEWLKEYPISSNEKWMSDKLWQEYRHRKRIIHEWIPWIYRQGKCFYPKLPHLALLPFQSV